MMEKPNPWLILIDGSSYFYRAFYAYPPLENHEGMPTGAMFGVLNMIRSLITEYPNARFAVVFDSREKTFRENLYPLYKANRASMPEELSQQFPPLNEAIKAMGIPIFIEHGVEADDVIGTLAKIVEAEGKQVLISTSDKDMAQLVTDNVFLINTMNNTFTYPDIVAERYGVPAHQIIDYLALRGDASDNIPGALGVGEKTAIALLNAYPSLAAIYENIDSLSTLSVRGAKTLADKLSNNKEIIDLSYTLATIKTDVEMSDALNKLDFQFLNINALKQIYTRYGFARWLAELADCTELTTCFINDFFKITLEKKTNKVKPISAKLQAPVHLSAESEEINKAEITENMGNSSSLQTVKLGVKDYRLITEEDQFNKLVDELAKAEIICFDTETDSLDYISANLVGVSFAITSHQAFYIPLGHVGVENQLPLKWALKLLKPIFENENIKKIGQNIKFDINILAIYGIEVKGQLFDTMLESYILDSLARHDMDGMAKQFLNYQTISYDDVTGKGRNRITFAQVRLEDALDYAAEDADITLLLHKYLWAKLKAIPSLEKVYSEIEIPLVPVLARMEQRGVRIDSQLLEEHSVELAAKLDKLETEAYRLAGETFNLSSPKQLQVIFYEKLGLPILQKTPKGAPSTNEEVLAELAMDFPLPKIILDYRGLSKLKGTYTDKLPSMVNAKDGRLHTFYHQAVTITGRLSSSDPNLQNIPIRNEEGRRIRKAFIAQDGFKIIAADYSQIELRIMAHLSRDEGLLTSFNLGEDIHRATAAEILGLPKEEVTVDQRRNAKAINFGLIYGMSAFGLAKQLSISRQEAQRYMDLYFQRYPGVQQYMENIRKSASEKGYVETIFGRRLYLPEIYSSQFPRRRSAERSAINAPMQGSAADIIKKAMINVDAILGDNPKVRMLMQVHDELVFEVHESCVDEYKQKIVSIMENCAQIAVPLRVDVGVGDNWEEAH